MTGARDPSIDALLAAARAQFAAGLPGRVEELRALAAGQAWEPLRRAAHRLRGSAATYGYPAIGDLAAAIEDALLAAPGGPGPDVRASIEQAVADARDAAARAAGGGA